MDGVGNPAFTKMKNNAARANRIITPKTMPMKNCPDAFFYLRLQTEREKKCGPVSICAATKE